MKNRFIPRKGFMFLGGWTRYLRSSLLRSSLGLIAALVSALYAQTWDGGAGNGNWNAANNWNPNALPISSTTTAILFSGNIQPATNQNLGNNFQVNSITFGAGMTSNFTVSGNSFIMAGAAPSIVQNSTFNGSLSNAINLLSTTTLSGTGTGALTLSGVLSGVGGITKTSANTATLSGNNTYTGLTTISNGILAVGNNNALGSGSSGTVVQSGGTLQLNSGISLNNAENLTLTGTGSAGLGALRNSGGNAAVNGNITLGGNTTVTSSTGTFTLGNSTTLDSIALGANTLTLNGNTGAFVVNSSISGSGNLIKDGTGTTTFNAANNTYTGTTTINNGTLAINTTANANSGILGNVTIGDGLGAANSATLQNSQNNVIANNASVTINSDGRWNLNAKTETVGSVGGTGSVFLGTGGALTTGGNNTSTTLSGAISGAGSLTKAGTGTMTLSAANTYTGATTISGGTINAAATNALGSTASVAINSGGTLLLSGGGVTDRVRNTATVNLNGGTIASTGTVTETMGALTLSTNSTIDMGTGSSIVTFASISRVGGSLLTVNNWTSGGSDRLLFTSTTGFNAAFLSQIQFSGYGVGATIVGNELVPVSAAIPESNNLIGGILVLLLLVSLEWHRHHQQKIHSKILQPQKKQSPSLPMR